MSVTTINKQCFPRLHYNSSAAITAVATSSKFTAGAIRWIGVVRCAFEAMTVTKVGIICSTLTTAGANALTLAIETVSTADGRPSGLWATNTSGTVTPAANGHWEATLTASATINRGDVYAITIKENGTDSDWVADFPGLVGSSQGAAFPYGCQSSDGTAWSSTFGNNTILPSFTLYSGSSYYHLFRTEPFQSSSSYSFDSGTTPDEIGLKFVANAPWRVCGAHFLGRINIDPIAVRLLDGANNILLTKNVDANQQVASNGNIIIPFDSSVTLTAGSTYRLTLLPSTTGTDSVLTYATVPSAGLMSATEMGAGWHSTKRTDAGAWTDTTTEVPALGIIVDGIDIPSGGSSHTF